jgi:hypothetical protein
VSFSAFVCDRNGSRTSREMYKSTDQEVSLDFNFNIVYFNEEVAIYGEEERKGRKKERKMWESSCIYTDQVENKLEGSVRTSCSFCVFGAQAWKLERKNKKGQLA